MMFKDSLELIRVAPPLCGSTWLEEHLNDHTMEEIQAQSIQVGRDGRYLPPVTAENGDGAVKKSIRGLRNGD